MQPNTHEPSTATIAEGTRIEEAGFGDVNTGGVGIQPDSRQVFAGENFDFTRLRSSCMGDSPAYLTTELLLGFGNSGHVVLSAGVQQNDGKKKAVAIKKVLRWYLTSVRAVETTRREVLIMKMLTLVDGSHRHPNVVQFFDAYETPTGVKIVMEHIGGGSLFERIVKAPYTEADALLVMYRLVSTLDWLHAIGILHRDVKPENILLLKGSKTDIKLIDFGVSNAVNQKGQCFSPCGSHLYRAPETFAKDSPDGGQPSYGAAAEIWACGVTLYTMLSGVLPFYAAEGVRHVNVISDPGQLEFPAADFPGVSEAAIAMIRSILLVDPTKRPKSTELLQHPCLRLAASTVGSDSDDGPIDRKRWPPSLLASIRSVRPGTVEELFSCMQDITQAANQNPEVCPASSGSASDTASACNDQTAVLTGSGNG